MYNLVLSCVAMVPHGKPAVSQVASFWAVVRLSVAGVYRVVYILQSPLGASVFTECKFYL